jgi:hypothetical protein
MKAGIELIIPDSGADSITKRWRSTLEKTENSRSTINFEDSDSKDDSNTAANGKTQRQRPKRRCSHQRYQQNKQTTGDNKKNMKQTNYSVANNEEDGDKEERWRSILREQRIVAALSILRIQISKMIAIYS